MARPAKEYLEEIEQYIIDHITTFSYKKISNNIKEKFNIVIPPETIRRKFGHLHTIQIRRFTDEHWNILGNNDLSIKQIQQIMKEKFNMDICLGTIGSLRHSRNMKKYTVTKKTTNEVLELIKNNLDKTSTEIRMLIYERFGITYSKDVFKNILYRHNWKCKQTNESVIYLDNNSNNLSKDNVIIENRSIAAKYYNDCYNFPEINLTHYKILKLEQAIKEIGNE